jgi:hypothetical protein
MAIVLSAAGAQGCSTATVSRRLRELRGGNGEPVPTASPLEPIPKAVEPPKPTPAPDVAATYDPVAQLERSVEALETIAQEIRDEGSEANVKDYAAIIRAQNNTIALAARLRPLPPSDPNEAPDLIAAADTCRKKVFRRLASLIENPPGRGAS